MMDILKQELPPETNAGKNTAHWGRRKFIAALTTMAAATRAHGKVFATEPRPIFLVPNFHPASCGWLTTFSRERVYCANTYLTHLDRVRDDPNYAFVLSEVNNIIAIMNFKPERIPELKQRVAEERVELVNGYFLESTINLSGGEALVRLGVLGLRWYEKVFGLKPRFSWNIDVCGTHDQMPQIAAGLGMDALIYARCNPTGQTLYWSVSPDGTRILTISPGGYGEASTIFSTNRPLTTGQMNELEAFFETKESITPKGAPIVIIGGGDYNTAPKVKEYPRRFLQQWAEIHPERKLRFTTFGKYVDTILPDLRSGKISIATMLGGTAYDFDSFWIENPRTKTEYRRSEHSLQAAEALSTIASLNGRFEYPVKSLANSWVLMCLNMDRNTLWGAAAGMVFVDDKSWDAQDRFNWVNKTTHEVFESSGRSLIPSGDDVGLFNPLNWGRNDPVALRLPAGKSLEGVECEALPDDAVLCQVEMPAASVGGWKLSNKRPTVPQPIRLPEAIETNHYVVRVDQETGALTSLKLRKSGRELFAASANVICANERLEHPERGSLATSNDQPSSVQAMRGPLSTTVVVEGRFYGGGAIRRILRFHQNHPRIDFETELNDIPEHTVVTSEFHLAENVVEVRRGIPYGFSHGAGTTPNPDLHGWSKGIVPAIRWIDFSLASGCGFTIFDRGLSGRELNHRTAIIYLMNAMDKYRGYDCTWLSGKGKHVLQYSVVAREPDWEQARIPYMAWEYNREPVIIANCAATPVQSFLETSDNMIVEALRREGDHIELRMVETLGRAGNAEVTLKLPHGRATITDLLGRKISTLGKSARYTVPVRPQQIVTMHFETPSILTEPESLVSWDSFVPEGKLAALHAYDPSLVGHPPSGR